MSSGKKTKLTKTKCILWLEQSRKEDLLGERKKYFSRTNGKRRKYKIQLLKQAEQMKSILIKVKILRWLIYFRARKLNSFSKHFRTLVLWNIFSPHNSAIWKAVLNTLTYTELRKNRKILQEKFANHVKEFRIHRTVLI